MQRRHLLAAAAGAALLPIAQAHTASHGAAPVPAKARQTPWGIAGDPKAKARTVEIAMTDAMRFTPDRVQARRGETIRFVVKNQGRMLHEMVIGTPEELDRHAEMMAKHPGMQHEEPYMTHVAPGATGTMVWNFNRTGDFRFACLIAGHYQAGMTGTIQVAAG